MKTIIESDKNIKIKDLKKLYEKNRERKSRKLFVVEGKQENKFALEAGFIPKEFYIQNEIFQSRINLPENAQIYYVTHNIYAKVAYRKDTEGIIGIYQEKIQEENYIHKRNSFILIIESIEKPGNLGAICRTADIFNIDLLFICDKKLDIYNPNVIRSSVGSVFNIPIFSIDKETLYNYLNINKIPIFATYMNETSEMIYKTDLTQSCAILFGTEHSGISSFWKDKIQKNILIPMQGKIDSLNVSNAVAITSYEVTRQRNEKTQNKSLIK